MYTTSSVNGRILLSTSQEINKALNDIWSVSSKLCGIFTDEEDWKENSRPVATRGQVVGECRYLEHSQEPGIVGRLHKGTQTYIYLPLLRAH